MKMNHRIIEWLSLLALATLNLQLSTIHAQGLSYTNWDNLITNWVRTSALSADWRYIVSSADGTNLTALGNGRIYTSTNAGVTWTQTSGPSAACIAASADGTKLAAEVEYGGGIYTSTNSGATWTRTSAPGEYWYAIASSADGTKLVAVTDGGGIYTSTNAGVTWTQTSAPNAVWFSVASSADGTKLAAVVWGGGIWTAKATIVAVAAPTIEIVQQQSTIDLSWPWLSAGWTLQQSTNLITGRWSACDYFVSTNGGVNSITISAPAGNFFFRLAKPSGS